MRLSKWQTMPWKSIVNCRQGSRGKSGVDSLDISCDLTGIRKPPVPSARALLCILSAPFLSYFPFFYFNVGAAEGGLVPMRMAVIGEEDAGWALRA